MEERKHKKTSEEAFFTEIKENVLILNIKRNNQSIGIPQKKANDWTSKLISNTHIYNHQVTTKRGRVKNLKDWIIEQILHIIKELSLVKVTKSRSIVK